MKEQAHFFSLNVFILEILSSWIEVLIYQFCKVFNNHID